MWRTYVICVLVGLLIAAAVGSAALVRQASSAQSEADGLRQRLIAAQSTQTALQ
jgi:predicted membrane-bound mannosyltransferase